MVNRDMQTRSRGFTLIELLIVLAILAVLLTLAAPRYFHSVDASKEAVLRENLRAVRDTLDKFRGDTGRYPDSLDELVERHYLRALPRDPLTLSSTTWELIPPADGSKGAVYDVRSGAPGADRNGNVYREW